MTPPTDRTDHLWAAGRALFDRWAAKSYRPVRLIGFGASQLAKGEGQMRLFAQAQEERRRTLDRVTDSIQTKFGSRSIRRGASNPRTGEFNPKRREE